MDSGSTTYIHQPSMPRLAYRRSLLPSDNASQISVSTNATAISTPTISTALTSPPPSEYCPSPRFDKFPGDASSPFPPRANLSRDQFSLPSPGLQPKKKGSFFSFLSVKEPSTQAWIDYQGNLKKAPGARESRNAAVGLPMVSTAKLPTSVPKVNSKWDGIPEKERLRKTDMRNSRPSMCLQDHRMGTSCSGQSGHSRSSSHSSRSNRLSLSASIYAGGPSTSHSGNSFNMSGATGGSEAVDRLETRKIVRRSLLPPPSTAPEPEIKEQLFTGPVIRETQSPPFPAAEEEKVTDVPAVRPPLRRALLSTASATTLPEITSFFPPDIPEPPEIPERYRNEHNLRIPSIPDLQISSRSETPTLAEPSPITPPATSVFMNPALESTGKPRENLPLHSTSNGMTNSNLCNTTLHLPSDEFVMVKSEGVNILAPPAASKRRPLVNGYPANEAKEFKLPESPPRPQPILRGYNTNGRVQPLIKPSSMSNFPSAEDEMNTHLPSKETSSPSSPARRPYAAPRHLPLRANFESEVGRPSTPTPQGGMSLLKRGKAMFGKV
ncbi:hypothetical protein MMC09_002825 [Bachmanniomyces sp. S44760]|nr:hypothetical protein [Bachmanniomyces sp. S44760]